jgi:hypothetical protein
MHALCMTAHRSLVLQSARLQAGGTGMQESGLVCSNCTSHTKHFGRNGGFDVGLLPLLTQAPPGVLPGFQEIYSGYRGLRGPSATVN